jgi:hypothetical protein
MSSREVGEKGKERGIAQPMFERWLRQSAQDEPYSVVGDVGEVTGRSFVRQATPVESTTSSLEYLDPEVEVDSHVQEEASPPAETLTAGIGSHQDILAFCGSWQ